MIFMESIFLIQVAVSQQRGPEVQDDAVTLHDARVDGRVDSSEASACHLDHRPFLAALAQQDHT